jgi:hypothetical protein
MIHSPARSGETVAEQVAEKVAFRISVSYHGIALAMPFSHPN